jgi:hypothetical protein
LVIVGLACAVSIFRYVVWRRTPNVVQWIAGILVVCWLLYLFCVPFADAFWEASRDRLKIQRDWDRDCDPNKNRQRPPHASLKFVKHCDDVDKTLATDPAWIAFKAACENMGNRFLTIGSYLFGSSLMLLVLFGSVNHLWQKNERSIYAQWQPDFNTPSK